MSRGGAGPGAAESDADPTSASADRMASMGLLGTLTGDPVLGNFGKAALKEATDRPDRMAKAGLHREQMLRAKGTREAMADPATAAAYRAALGEILPGVDFSNAPASTMAELMKDRNLASVVQERTRKSVAQEAADAKRDVADTNSETRKLTSAQAALVRGQAGQMQDAKFNQKLADNYQKDMDAAGAGARTPFGQAANIVFRGKRIMNLLANGQTSLTPQEMSELGASLAAMTTGGAPTQHTIQQFTPKNIKTDAAGLLQWLTSSPQGTEQKEWVKRITGQLEREEQAGKDMIRQTQLERQGRHGQFFSRTPEIARAIIKRIGLDQPHPLGSVDPQSFAVLPGVAPPPPKAPTGPAKVQGDADYDALPSGAVFIGPDGKKRTKP